jgi:uncharacterized protein YndB with AHSA1/START domain
MAKNISKLTINASRQQVWDAITKPELVKRWQYGSELLTTWKVGDPIKFRTEWQGKVFEQWGQVREFLAGEILRYTLFAPRPGLEDVPENYFLMTYVLAHENGVTTLEIIQDDDRPAAVQEPQQGEENPVLKALKHVAESA